MIIPPSNNVVNLYPKSRAFMIHGAGGGAWEWEIWQRIFKVYNWDTYAITLQPTQNGLAQTSLADYFQQTLTWISSETEKYPDIPYILIGASLGGLLVLQCLEHYSPQAVVLVNPMLPAPWQSLLPQKNYSTHIIDWQSKMTLAYTHQTLPNTNEANCRYAWRRWRNESVQVLQQARHKVITLKKTTPTLLMCSEMDKSTPITVTRQWADNWEADIYTIRNANHLEPLLGNQASFCAEHALNWHHSIAVHLP